jgi:outer membrane protein assembly factor BamB
LFSTPEAAAGKVYVGGADRYLYCLDERTGRLM